MDSLSQFTLGAAVAEATLGQRLGRRAILVGGLLGTLPDLDVLVHYSDAVASFTFHRSWSHSLFVLGLASIPIAWLLWRFYPVRWIPADNHTASSANNPVFRQWLMCVFLVFMTHALLDGFTIYGTQLFWPLNAKPVAIGSIFIIDPLYTLPLLIALFVAFRFRARAQRAVLIGLSLSTAYLAITLVAQQSARTVALRSLQQQNLSTDNVLIAPAPFSVLWRVVSMDNDYFHEGFYSLLDDDKQMEFASYPTQRTLINEHAGHWPVARLDWFTSGMISANHIDDSLIINDLRMGIESSYVFRFNVGRLNAAGFEPLESQQLPLQMNNKRMRAVLRRAWDEHVNVLP